MIQNRTCRECSCPFEGGPRAYYCPSCRHERTKKTYRDYRRRKVEGTVRPIGSKDTCERCSKTYTVEGGNQRFCQECQPIHTIEYDRETALTFYHENKERINPPRKIKRRKRSNICLTCEKEFEPINGSTTCSDDCKRQLDNKRTRESYQRAKERNAPPEETYGMSQIAREIGKHKGTVQYAYAHGKLPTPDGFSPSGRPFWYHSTILHILKRGATND